MNDITKLIDYSGSISRMSAFNQYRSNQAMKQQAKPLVKPHVTPKGLKYIVKQQGKYQYLQLV